MHELIGQRLIFCKAVDHLWDIGTGCITIESDGSDARFDDTRIGVSVHRIYLALFRSEPIDQRVHDPDDVLRLPLGCSSRWIGTGGCDDAASDEQHGEYSFHNRIVFLFLGCLF
jgi:hypothetical protein